MKRILFFLFLSLFTSTIYSQTVKNDIIKRNPLELDNNNTWAVGGGFSNFIMHGDLRSIGTGNMVISGILELMHM